MAPPRPIGWSQTKLSEARVPKVRAAAERERAGQREGDAVVSWARLGSKSVLLKDTLTEA